MAKLREKHYTDAKGKRHRSNYQAEFYDASRHPKRKRVSLGTKNKVAAELKMHELERDYVLGVYDPWEDKPAESIPLSVAVGRFIKRQRRLGCAEDTVAYYESLLNRLVTALPVKLPVRDVRCEHIESFLDECEIGAESTKTYVRHFRTFFNWALEQGLIGKSAFTAEFDERMRRLPDDPLPAFFTLEQFEKLCAAADKHAQSAYVSRHRNPASIGDAIRFLYLIGCRPKELETLTWRDVDLDTGFVHFRKTKNRKQRKVPMPERLREHLLEMNERRSTPSDADELVFTTATGLPFTKEARKNLTRRVGAFCKALGLPSELNLYSLRHGFATAHAMHGTPARLVVGMMGQQSLEMNDVYAHYHPEGSLRWQNAVFGEPVDLKAENERLKAENEELRAEIERLKVELQGALIDV